MMSNKPKAPDMERVATSIATGGLMAFAFFAMFIFYVNWFNAHHIVDCSDKPGYETAVTKWEWVKSWVLPVDCGD